MVKLHMQATSMGASSLWILTIFIILPFCCPSEPPLGTSRFVFQTKFGDIEFGFFEHIAPKTVDHIRKLIQLGAYNTNHFFRVDKGFVAQVADVVGGREAPLNAEQKEEGEKTIVGEFSDVKHTKGILSMGRYSDPDSASSSFSILLGDAPHLDGQYAIFGKVTKGYDTLARLEELPTKREGIFVMPLERITILSTYYYETQGKTSEVTCEQEVALLRQKLADTSFMSQGILLGSMLGIPLGCMIILATAWKREWWQGTPKRKSSSLPSNRNPTTRAT